MPPPDGPGCGTPRERRVEVLAMLPRLSGYGSEFATHLAQAVTATRRPIIISQFGVASSLVRGWWTAHLAIRAVARHRAALTSRTVSTLSGRR